LEVRLAWVLAYSDGLGEPRRVSIAWGSLALLFVWLEGKIHHASLLELRRL